MDYTKDEIDELIQKHKEYCKNNPLKLRDSFKDELYVNYMIETNREDNEAVKAIQERAYNAYLKVAEKLSDEEIEIIKHAMRVKAIY